MRPWERGCGGGTFNTNDLYRPLHFLSSIRLYFCVCKERSPLCEVVWYIKFLFFFLVRETASWRLCQAELRNRVSFL